MTATASSAQAQSFGDRPIGSAADDRLGRAQFVTSLAAHLLRTPKDDSAVFSLCGPWGSGKTSILNLAEEELGKVKDVTVLRFNPWLFSGTEQLVTGFFRELAAQLMEKNEKRLQKVAAGLEGVGEALAGLGGLPVIGGFFKAGGGIAALSAKGVNKKGKGLPKSLENQRKHLSEILKKLEGRVVVLIDDIDRLRHEEIRDIMRLVRLVADLPRMVYLLAFDRARVVEALSESGQSGQAYLEKIVQVGLVMPEPAHVDLAKLLEEEVNRAIRGRHCNQADLDNVFHLVLRPMFRNARDVRRFANALPFVFDLLGEEVALPDLLALAALQVIHPVVAERLGEVAHLLTDVGDGERGDYEADKTTLREFIDSAGDDAETLRALCRQVFPPSKRFMENTLFGTEWLAGWRKNGRVAHSKVLRTYLEGRPPPGELPMSVVRKAAAAMGTSEWAAVTGSMSAEVLEALFWRLKPYVEDLSTELAFLAVLEISVMRARLRSGSQGLGDPFGADTPFNSLLLSLLKRASGDTRSTEVLERALSQVATLSGRVALIARVNDRESGFGSKADAERLEAVLSDAVAAASPDQLASEYYVDRLLHVAVTQGKLTKEQIAARMNVALLVALLRTHVSESFRQNMGEAATTRTDKIAWPALCRLMPEEELRTWVQRVAATPPEGLDDRAALAVQLAVRRASRAAAEPEEDED